MAKEDVKRWPEIHRTRSENGARVLKEKKKCLKESMTSLVEQG